MVGLNVPSDYATADDANAISISNRVFNATLPSKMHALVVTKRWTTGYLLFVQVW